MRIIAGQRRGKKLFTPENDAIRPTGDRARAALFNILTSQQWIAVQQPLPIGARVLDLACGTGALACEALSRGAASAILYDNNASSLALAKENIAAIGSEARAVVAFADLTRLPSAQSPFDLIFCDPPYGQELAAAALQQLQPQGYLRESALIVAETGASEALRLPDELRLFDSRRYGAAKLWFIGVGR
jgi:16S rRNA (guanine966-N2)-methyltransferase